MSVQKGDVVRRGDFMTIEVLNLTRVTHSKTADIIELDGGYLVVPVEGEFPIRRFESFSDAMGFIENYVKADA